MRVRAAWLLPGGDSPGQTREDTRLAPVGTWTPDGALRTRAGIVPGGDPLAASGSGPMEIRVSTGRAVVQGTSAQGAYPVAVTDPEILTLGDGDAQYPRIDTVVLRVYDDLYDAADDTAATIEIVAGSPDPDPDAPTLPVSCLPLWDVTVPAGTSAGTGGLDWSGALSDRRRYTVAAGGIVPRGSGSDDGHDGQYADHDGALMRWSEEADGWQPYPYDSGWQPLTLASGYAHPGHGHTPAWRRTGATTIMLRGRIGRSDGNTIPNADEIASLPTAIRPSQAVSWAASREYRSSGGPSTIRVEISAAGYIRIYEGVSRPEWISLDCTYTTD